MRNAFSTSPSKIAFVWKATVLALFVSDMVLPFRTDLIKDLHSTQLFRQRVGAGLGDLGVLRRQRAGDADGADDFAVNHDRQPAFERVDVFHSKQAKPRAARGNSVVESLARALESNRRARFAFGRANGREL